MYSKEKGITYGKPSGTERSFEGISPFGEPAYRRRQPVRVPANYSGHAIVDGEERPLGSLPLVPLGAEPELPRSPAASPEPHFEGLPKVSELGDRRLPPPRILPAEDSSEDSGLAGGKAAGKADGGEGAEEGAEDRLPILTPPMEREEKSASSPKPSAISIFGHGIGTEELLILGLILFLLLEGGEGEDKGDLTETVILLGLLLMLGW